MKIHMYQKLIKKSEYGCLLRVFAVLFLLFGLGVQARTAEKFVNFDRADVETIREPFEHQIMRDSGGNIKYRLIETVNAAPDIQGYGGPINLFLVLNAQGEIAKAEVISHRETPSFVTDIEEFLNRFVGINIFSGDEPLREVDAMTSATETSNAVVKIVDRVAKELQAIEVEPEKTELNPVQVVWTGFIITGILFYHLKKRYLRYILMGSSIAVLGYYYSYYYTLAGWVSVLNLNLGQITGNLNWFFLFGVPVIIGVFFGQLYCGYLCPVGACQEFISMLGRKLRILIIIERKIEDGLRKVKFIILVIISIAFVTGIFYGGFRFNPLQYFFVSKVSIWEWILFFCVIIFPLFFFRFWCRYLCPAGALLALTNKLSFFDIHEDNRIPPRCIMRVKDKRDIDCIKCNRCLK